ncbi:MAG: sigma-70 family RNA polymerase sigma factor [Phycisphaerae bacterium]|nr:sigma-70 family RNA polymerase sigma factor [Phycisphaerae bacterium]
MIWRTSDIQNQPGDASSLCPAELVRSYSRAVLSVCLARMNNRHDAEDVMQDVFVKAIKQLHRLKNPARVGPWILQIARNTCIDHLRRRKPTEPLPEHIPVPEDTSPDHLDFLDHLHSTIRRLPPDHAEALSLYYMDGHNSSHVAALLGITPAAVRQRLVRARALLHELLREEDQ